MAEEKWMASGAVEKMVGLRIFHFFATLGQGLSYALIILGCMNKNPILPNWQLPRRRPFTAHRGITLLRAWRERFAQTPRELHVQTQFVFARPN